MHYFTIIWIIHDTQLILIKVNYLRVFKKINSDVEPSSSKQVTNMVSDERFTCPVLYFCSCKGEKKLFKIITFLQAAVC